VDRIFETKARYPDLARARRLLFWIGAAHTGTQRQADIYFRVGDGWLKLRQSRRENAAEERDHAELIGYRRSPDGTVGVCTYQASAVADGDAIGALLGAALGVTANVRKRRETWIFRSTIIHLDEVANLGSFVELETTPARSDENTARYQHLRMAWLLGIRRCHRVRGSYANLLAQSRPEESHDAITEHRSDQEPSQGHLVGR
jgi:adenylate cyclase class IV